jgi:enamine deaminase RidA (YjgF/YER057c/UK114 family)
LPGIRFYGVIGKSQEGFSMRKKIFQWLGREFVALSCEGKAGLVTPEQTQDIFRRFDEELRSMGLSLENTVRTRLWARDRQSRNLASNERLKVLSGKARSASSSYIAPGHFDSDARVALNLLAMRPSRPGLERILKEYDPPIVPLRYLIYDSVVFLSGVTAVLPTLVHQMANILPRITDSLRDAGSSWDKAVKVSFFLHRSQKLETLNEFFRKHVRSEIPQMEYGFVDGYSAEGKLIEIEVTAMTSR